MSTLYKAFGGDRKRKKQHKSQCKVNVGSISTLQKKKKRKLTFWLKLKTTTTKETPPSPPSGCVMKLD